MIGNLKSVTTGLLFLTLASFYCVSIVVAQDTQQTTNKKTCSISGLIRVDGKPLAGADVELFKTYLESSRRDSVGKFKTNKAGLYSITRIPPGTYDVSPSAPSAPAPNEGSFSQSGRSVVVDAGENLKDIDFDLLSSGSLSGRVADVDGNPVVGEYISLTITRDGRYANHFSPAESAKMETDEDGHYHIANVPPGHYWIEVGTRFGISDSAAAGKPHPYYLRTFYPDAPDEIKAIAVEVMSGRESTADITVPRPLKTYDILGQVVEIESGIPAPNIGLGLITQNAAGNSTSESTGALKSDSEGRFKITSATPGHYVVYAENDKASNTYGERIEFDVKDQDVKGLRINMHPAASISGVLTTEGLNDELTPDQIKTIGLYARTMVPNQNSGGYPTRIGADGLFRISGIRPGKVRMSLSLYRTNIPAGIEILRVERNGVRLPDEVELNDRENLTGLRVLIGAGPEGCILKGQVKSDSGPLSGINLYVLYRPTSGPPGTYHRAGLDVRGRFAIGGLTPGEYELMVGPMSVEVSGEAGRETVSRMQTTKQTLVVVLGNNPEVTMVVTLAPRR